MPLMALTALMAAAPVSAKILLILLILSNKTQSCLMFDSHSPTSCFT
jgi:hypothetical protein